MDLLQLLKGSSSSSSSSGNASDSDNNEEKEPPQRHTGKHGGEEDEEDEEDDDDLNNNNNNAEPKGKRRIKKRRLGSVSILLSSQVPTTNTTNTSNATNALFVRSVPHRKGHWSGHVMVPVLIDSSSPFLQQQQQKTIHKFQKELEQRGYSGTLVQHESLHLSLSKFFSLQLGCIEPFVQRLKTRLQHQHSTRLFMDTNYNYNYNNNNNQETNILVNDEKTRSFLGWNVVPNSDLFRLVGHVDDVLKSYNQPSYYQPPRFHVSIASFPGNLKDMSPMNENNDKEEEDEEDSIDDDNDDHNHRYCINVDRVWCKFGTTKSYEIPLQSSPAAHKHR